MRSRQVNLWVVKAYMGREIVAQIEVWSRSRAQAYDRGYEALISSPDLNTIEYNRLTARIHGRSSKNALT